MSMPAASAAVINASAVSTAVHAGVNAALGSTPTTPEAYASAAAYYMAVPARYSLEYALGLVKDIPADKFAHMPHSNMNHPAFNIGHLAIYPNRLFTLIDRKDLIVENPRYTELFAAGVQCVEQDGRYPDKTEIVNSFTTGYRKVLDVLPTVSDEVLARQNPIEGRMRERFPLIGVAVNFLLSAHTMTHLGQISAWRRAIGLPSVM